MNKSRGRTLRYAFGMLAGLVWALPLVGVLMASVRPYGEIIDGWWNLSEFHTTLENYHYVLFQTSLPMLLPLWNSLWSSVLGALLPTFFGSMAAYAFARHRFPGKALLLVVIVCLMAVPAQMIAIPVFRRMNDLGLLDSLISVILMNTVTALPWILFFLTNIMKGLDPSTEEAGKIDGASEFRLYLSVVLPQIAPALVSVFVLQFVWSWNTFFWPLILVFDQNNLVATQVIPMLRGQFYTNWGYLASAAVLVMVVPVAVFLGFQRSYVEGQFGFSAEK